MSLSGSPLVVGVPGCACLGVDPVRVMQISACLAEPLGVTAFGTLAIQNITLSCSGHTRRIIYLLVWCSVP